MITPKFLADIKNGKLVLREPEKFNQYIKSLKNTVEVIIRYPRKLRSLQENKYYWGVIVKLISDHTGHSKEDIHSVLKEMFLTEHLSIMDKDYKYTRSTTRLTTKEIEEYFEKCRQWAAEELGLYIPLPNEIEIGGEYEP